MPIPLRSSGCWFAAAASLSLPGWAQTRPREAPAPTELETVAGEAVVSAPSRRRESLLDTSRSVSVDSRREATRALARDVGERLDELPGVFVQRTTSGSAAPVLRGLGGQRTLLLFDGLRLNDSLTKVGGNALLTLIDPASVQRVEVVRGAASVLYGSDALGGVVAVTPLDALPHPDGATHLHGEVTVRGAAAERSVLTQGLVEGESGRYAALLSGSLGSTGRVFAGGHLGDVAFTGYDDHAVSARAVVAPSDRHRLGVALTTGAVLDAPRPDLSVPGDTRVFRLQRRDLGYVHGQARLGDRGRLVGRVGAMQREEVRDRFRADRTDTESDTVQTLHAGLQAELAWTRTRITTGFELAWDHVGSQTVTTRPGMDTVAGRGRYVDGSRYLTGGLYALWQQRFGGEVWSTELGARVALVDARGPVDGPNPALDRTFAAPVASAGVRWRPARGVALMASVLGGFRAPNLDDFQALGSGARSFDVPNPSLGPERSWTAEVGARWMRGPVAASAHVYGATLDGLITRVPGRFEGQTMVEGRRVYTRANASDGRLAGAEVEVTVRSRRGFAVGAAVWGTWAEATTVDEAGVAVREPLAKVPPWMGRVTLGWRGARVWVDAVLTGGLAQTRLARSDRDDVRLCPQGAEACREVPGWSTVALRVGAQVTAHALAAVAIENILDSPYTPYGGGYTMPGRNVMALLRFLTD